MFFVRASIEGRFGRFGTEPSLGYDFCFLGSSRVVIGSPATFSSSSPNQFIGLRFSINPPDFSSLPLQATRLAPSNATTTPRAAFAATSRQPNIFRLAW
jgi:hypothetical protein